MIEVVREENSVEAQPADVVGRVDVVVPYRETMARTDVDVAANEELVVVDGAGELIEAARIVVVLVLQRVEDAVGFGLAAEIDALTAADREAGRNATAVHFEVAEEEDALFLTNGPPMLPPQIFSLNAP